MANRRLYQFNAGCSDAPCCEDEDTSCPDICITVDSGGSPVSGVTVNGYTLGSQVTGSDGRVCFAVSGPGHYVLRTSKTGYRDNAISVDVTDEDCTGAGTIERNVPITPTTLPEWCKDILVRSCNCGLGGATLVLSMSNGYSAMVTTDWFGWARICIPVAKQGPSTWTITASAPDHVTQVVSGSTDIFTPFGGTLAIDLAMVDATQRYCFRNLPDGFTDTHCVEYAPGTLSVSFAGDWPAGLAGHTITLVLDGVNKPFTWRSGCLTPPVNTLWKSYSVLVQSPGGPSTCGTKQVAIIQVVFNLNFCVSAFGDMLLEGNSSREPGGSPACPVMFYTGCPIQSSGGEAYSTVRTATVSE